MDFMYKISLLIACFSLTTIEVDCSASPCKDPYLVKCLCGETDYINKKQYVVNCTNVGFNSTKPLERLPDKTQVLLFTGNNIPELQSNVFGLENNTGQLRVIDMSNNGIKIIHGKAFHKVSSVERLILNHNELTADQHHFRVFSNFENLLELHLTNAFTDNSGNLSSHLHSTFLGSDLMKLRKIHLEQNEIRTLKDEPLIFCTLVGLLDLHLGNNKLEHIDFRLDCLKHLRFLDLERNAISYLTKDELSQLDVFPKRNQSFMIDLADNPFTCGYQIEDFFSWLSVSQVEVRNKNKLKCKHDSRNADEPLFLHASARGECGTTAAGPPPPQPPPSGISPPVVFLLLLFLATLALLIYTNREPIRVKTQPIFLSLSKKVQYTTIGKNEVHEMEV